MPLPALLAARVGRRSGAAEAPGSGGSPPALQERKGHTGPAPCAASRSRFAFPSHFRPESLPCESEPFRGGVSAESRRFARNRAILPPPNPRRNGWRGRRFAAPIYTAQWREGPLIPRPQIHCAMHRLAPNFTARWREGPQIRRPPIHCAFIVHWILGGGGESVARSGGRVGPLGRGGRGQRGGTAPAARSFGWFTYCYVPLGWTVRGPAIRAGHWRVGRRVGGGGGGGSPQRPRAAHVPNSPPSPQKEGEGGGGGRVLVGAVAAARRARVQKAPPLFPPCGAGPHRPPEPSRSAGAALRARGRRAARAAGGDPRGPPLGGSVNYFFLESFFFWILFRAQYVGPGDPWPHALLSARPPSAPPPVAVQPATIRRSRARERRGDAPTTRGRRPPEGGGADFSLDGPNRRVWTGPARPSATARPARGAEK